MGSATHISRELARKMEAAGLRREIVPGDVYRIVPNSVLNFDDRSEDHFHPAVVVGIDGEYAEVCIRTSKISGNRRAGIFHNAQPEMGLDRPGMILTRLFGRRRIHVRHLKQSNYLYNIGLSHLLLIWISMWFMGPRSRASSASLHRATHIDVIRQVS